MESLCQDNTQDKVGKVNISFYLSVKQREFTSDLGSSMISTDEVNTFSVCMKTV